MKLLYLLINSNIYISLAAVLLTITTQIQLKLQPHLHPYLFLIFFATLFEYNLHRLITILTSKESLNTPKHQWVKNNLKLFYFIVFLSVTGFLFTVILARKIVLFTLAPIAILTLFYSTPISIDTKKLFRFREIPYLKIFLIAMVWSASTILLPVLHNGGNLNIGHLTVMLIERFLFIFAITIPFDIRDMSEDNKHDLKTIPLLLGKNKSISIATLAMILFWLITTVHYFITSQLYLILAFTASAAITIAIIRLEKFQKSSIYHYGILDGTMTLQGILVLISYAIDASINQ
ncbi:MAG: UbiA family prenyltransferase [Saprospiraceae bacterium]|nr:UbiA family prenyltransferase [Saprospiraceae bacterium]